MIVRITLENWMAFRDSTNYSLIASQERWHRERLPRFRRQRMTVLPIMALFGANGAGKSSFVKLLAFIQGLVVEGLEPGAPIPIRPYDLDSRHPLEPLRFDIDVMVDEALYSYHVLLSRSAVLEETLTLHSATRDARHAAVRTAGGRAPLPSLTRGMRAPRGHAACAELERALFACGCDAAHRRDHAALCMV